MMSVQLMSFPVPIVVIDPSDVIEANAAWCKWWISMWTPPTHEVIAWPKVLAELPHRPDIAPEDLPDDVLRFVEA